MADQCEFCFGLARFHLQYSGSVSLQYITGSIILGVLVSHYVMSRVMCIATMFSPPCIHSSHPRITVALCVKHRTMPSFHFTDLRIFCKGKLLHSLKVNNTEFFVQPGLFLTGQIRPSLSCRGTMPYWQMKQMPTKKLPSQLAGQPECPSKQEVTNGGSLGLGWCNANQNSWNF